MSDVELEQNLWRELEKEFSEEQSDQSDGGAETSLDPEDANPYDYVCNMCL